MVWSHPSSLTPPGKKWWPHFWTSPAKTSGRRRQTTGAVKKKMMYLRPRGRKQPHPKQVTFFSPQMCNVQIPSVQFEFLSSYFLFEGPTIVTEEDLASLAVISPVIRSQSSGSRVKALIQILQHQLDQQDLLKEFMVCTNAVIQNNYKRKTSDCMPGCDRLNMLSSNVVVLLIIWGSGAFAAIWQLSGGKSPREQR